MAEQETSVLPEADPTAFARHLLASLGLPDRPLRASGGWSNRVWLAPAHVVRLSSGRFRDAFAHEAAVLHLLPPAVPHARVCAYRRAGEREWLVLERLPGRPLARAWPRLSMAPRRAAASQLGEALRALHATPLPVGFRNPWLADAFTPGGRPENAYHAPPAVYRRLLAAAERVSGVDRGLLDELGAFIAERLPAFTGHTAVLVHGDAHFGNLLWDGHRLSAVLDFEGSQPAAADQELDTLLRFVREPELYRDPGGAAGPVRRDLAALPDWLAAAYPALFAHPRLPARLAIYEALWHLVQLQHFPPGRGAPDPWGHLRALLDAGERWPWR